MLETPLTVDDEDGTTPLLGDSDDPAIWVNPADPNDSRVIVTLKDGGAATFNLQGELQQTILPADYGDIRYNNVDLLYGVEVPAFNPIGSFTTDIAVMSDRANDTLAIFGIDITTGELYDLTAPTLSDLAFSIFGVDDGEATAYGLATYLSPVTGKLYAFVTQASGNQVAQLELTPQISPADASYIDAKVVRIIDLPVPTEDVEDSQFEGLVIDQELGQLYVSLENEVGILKHLTRAQGIPLNSYGFLHPAGKGQHGDRVNAQGLVTNGIEVGQLGQDDRVSPGRRLEFLPQPCSHLGLVMHPVEAPGHGGSGGLVASHQQGH